MRSKYFFEQFDEQLKEEKEKFKAKSETVDVPIRVCKHKGKVSIIDGELRCKCGAAWSGPEIETLYKIFNKI